MPGKTIIVINKKLVSRGGAETRRKGTKISAFPATPRDTIIKMIHDNRRELNDEKNKPICGINYGGTYSAGRYDIGG